MYIKRVKGIIDNLVDKIRDFFKDVYLSLYFLKENNIAQAVDFFEVGLLEECKNRLRIAIKLWPKDDYIKYLLSIVYLLSRDRNDAIELLKTINNFNKKRVDKMIILLEKDKIKRVIDKYIDTFNLYEVENEIDKI